MKWRLADGRARHVFVVERCRVCHHCRRAAGQNCDDPLTSALQAGTKFRCRHCKITQRAGTPHRSCRKCKGVKYGPVTNHVARETLPIPKIPYPQWAC